jgi:hypothetical protein
MKGRKKRVNKSLDIKNGGTHKPPLQRVDERLHSIQIIVFNLKLNDAKI